MRKTIRLTLILTIAFFAFNQSVTNAQAAVNRDTVLIAAREIITSTPYCALSSIGSDGKPHIRTMNPFPLNSEFITWFATSRESRKVKELKIHPDVCVYWADHTAPKGYVVISGKAQVIDDKDLLVKMKRDYWQGIPDWQNKFVLIKIVPVTMEVINYKHSLNNDLVTSGAPSITF